MINLKETFNFLTKHGITFEELGILLTIYYRTQSSDINKLALEYYKENLYYNDISRKRNVPIQWRDIVENLIERGYIEDLRSPVDKQAKEISLKKLKVTPKFLDIVFIQKDDAYKYIKSLYPDWGYLANKEKYFTKLGNDDIMSKIVYDDILQGGNKERFEMVCFIMKEMFDYCPEFDSDGNIVGGKPTKPAKMKFENFLKIFNQIEEDFKNNENDTYEYM